MKPESHIEAFEERKDTIFKWGIEVRGLERSQRILGDNASKAISDLLSAYLHKNHIIEEGFQINHSWFKSEKVLIRFPEFDNKSMIIKKMIELENLCEKLSYGVQKPVDESRKALKIFKELENKLKEMIE